ncbi:uncharacterized protein LOC124149057 [Haliotis rufescens]|uniref:uncharacterized protein LOC124149057 n=1 Tax=Haliotis rufescens TaxID=6454 RepID=UPI00201F265A|nr:uncharacterized protein LOC124149057 [Haliotis rufescens]
MLTFQHTLKGLLLLACLYTCSGAPLTCNPVRSAECFANFSQEIMRVALPHLAQNISVANTNLSFVSQLCSEYTLTYLPCVTPALVGCPAWSYITYEMTSAAAEYICHSRETVVRSALECLSVPTVAPAVMGCNEAALASTEPCHPAYTWQKCISDVTSDVCTVSSNAALSDVIAHSLQPMFDLYPCHNDSGTSVTSEPEPEITGETVSSEPEPEITGETVSSEPEPEVTSTPSDVCNLPAFTMCSAELNQDLQVWMANVIPDMMLTRSFNFSHLDTLCSVHYRKYKQCVWSVTLGCRKDLMLSRDIMVSAFDFICSADKEALSSTIPCISQPSVAQGMQSCAYTASTSGVCSYTTNYKKCVSDVISGCTSSAKDVINDLVDTLLKPLKETFPCDVDISTVLPTFLTSTTTKPTFNTTTRVTPTPQIVTGGATGTGQCGRECKDLLNVPISRMPTALMAGNFSLTIYTDACPLFESFRQCMAALSDPCEIPAVENSVFSSFEYACGKGYSAIIEYDDCWERTDLQATWTSCINEFSASLANGSQDGLCRYLDRVSLCVTEKVAACGQVPVAIVTDYFNASTYVVRRLFNCSLAQPTTMETTTIPAVPTAHSSSPTSTTPTSTSTTPASTTNTPNSTTTSPASTSVAASVSSHQNQTVTTPKLPITCFDCNSGYSSSRNTQCTIDGHIATNLVGKTTCMDRCFAKTNKWNKGVIFRGCAAGFWMPEARPLPRSGCHMIREEMWCFCDGDFCNDMPMARFV